MAACGGASGFDFFPALDAGAFALMIVSWGLVSAGFAVVGVAIGSSPWELSALSEARILRVRTPETGSILIVVTWSGSCVFGADFVASASSLCASEPLDRARFIGWLSLASLDRARFLLLILGIGISLSESISACN